MTAYNVVRTRVKPGREKEFIDLHRKMKPAFRGWRGGALVKTGDRSYCLIGEWTNFKSIVAARPMMIGILDSMRDMLEDLGGGLGVSDPVSGDAVLQLKGSQAAKKRAKPKAKRKAAKAARKPAKKKKAAKKAVKRRRR